MRMSALKRNQRLMVLLLAGVAATGCQKKAAAPAAGAGGALPVQTVSVALSPVAQSSEFVATIKSRRSATLQPQVEGRITEIRVHSGDHVAAGQGIMNIDPLHQQAAVDSASATERQKKALYDYNTLEQERQKKLFDAGIISRDTYEQAEQSYQNTKADYQAAVASTKTQEEQLAYYSIRAPFDGVVGDIPVHVGDYVSPSSPNPVTLTTIDENQELEAYIYVPTERAGQVKMGLPVDLMDTTGTVLARSIIYFVSPEVDNGLQGILAKAPIPRTAQRLRNGQMVNARITWSSDQTATVPVLAVTSIGGQTFVYVAAAKGAGYAAHQVSVTLGEPVGNVYPVLAGLRPGDRVILSGIQFLQEGVPVQPLGPAGAGAGN